MSEIGIADPRDIRTMMDWYIKLEQAGGLVGAVEMLLGQSTREQLLQNYQGTRQLVEAYDSNVQRDPLKHDTDMQSLMLGQLYLRNTLRVLEKERGAELLSLGQQKPKPESMVYAYALLYELASLETADNKGKAFFKDSLLKSLQQAEKALQTPPTI